MHTVLFRVVFVLTFFIFSANLSHSQVLDHFEDSSLVDFPIWQGTLSSFTQEGDSLRLLAPDAGTAWLSTASAAIDSAKWTFDCYLGFNPSSSNFVRYYLSSDSADLSGSLQGYFVMLGNTSDEVSLYRQDGLSTTEIIDGTDGLLDLSSVAVSIKVIRDEAGNWSLYADSAQTGTFQLQGSTADDTYAKSAYTGFFATFTSTRKDKVWFDNLEITGTAHRDRQAPILQNWVVGDSNQVCLWFDEALASPSVDQFFLSPGGMPESTLFQGDSLCLQWPENFAQGQWHKLTLSVADSLGNTLSDTLRFFYFDPPELAFGAVRINEILADPSPAVSMPASEMIELYNASEHLLLLKNWLFTDGSTFARLDSVYLPAKGFLLLSPADEAWQWSSYGQVMGLSKWPTLNNSGDLLRLLAPDSLLIDAVTYELSWYRYEDKSSGGYSLERINPWPVCDGSDNWLASIDSLGGSPGYQNSVFDTLPDLQAPSLLDAIVQNADSIWLYFDEAPDSTSLHLASLTISGIPASLHWQSTDPKQVLATLTEPLAQEQWHLLISEGFRDCPGNQSNPDSILFYFDQQGPSLMDWAVRSETELVLWFSEPLQKTAAEDEGHYLLNSLTAPARASLLNDTTVLLRFDSAFAERQYTLQLSGIKDTLANVSGADSLIWYFRNDIDGVGVLASDLIRITFREVPLLDEMQLEDHFSIAGMLPIYWQASEDSLSYLLAWEGELPANKDVMLYFSRILDRAGGRLICPAQTLHYDTRAPKVIDWTWTATDSLLLYFSEPIDSATAMALSAYQLKDFGSYPYKVSLPDESSVLLQFADSIFPETDYTLQISSISDLAGNVMGNQRLSIRFDQNPPHITGAFVWQDTLLQIHFSEAVVLRDSGHCIIDGRYTGSWHQNPYVMDQVSINFPDKLPRKDQILLQCFGLADVPGNTADSLGFYFDHAQPALLSARFWDETSIELIWSVAMDSTGTGYWVWDASMTQSLLPVAQTEAIVLNLPALLDKAGNSWPGDTLNLSYKAALRNLSILNPYTLELSFAEGPEAAYLHTSNFLINPANAITAVLKDENNPTKLRLLLSEALRENENYTLVNEPGYYQTGKRLPGGSKPLFIDRIPPQITAARLLSDREIALHFGEAMNPSSLALNSQYQPALGTIQHVAIASDDSVVLSLSIPVIDGDSLLLRVQGLLDQSNNVLQDTSLYFVYHALPVARVGDLIINEIMYSPDGAKGLTNQEYLEIYNRSDQPFQLKGYQIADASSSTQLPGFWLEAGAYLAIQTANTGDGLPDSIALVGVDKLPSLNNNGDILYLINSAGDTLDWVRYETRWHDAKGSHAGISLERVNPLQEQCFPHLNWRSSTAALGGSPGEQNPVYDTLPDQSAPLVISMHSNHVDSVWLQFSEPMDTSHAGNLLLDGSLVSTQFAWLDSYGQELVLHLQEALIAGMVHTLHIQNWKDCSGNSNVNYSILSGKGRKPKTHELVFNEIMAIPQEASTYPLEYVELHNRSTDLLSLDSVGFADSRDTLWLPDFLVPADSFVVLYPSTGSAAFAERPLHLALANWPGLNNGGETLRLLSAELEELHRLSYTPGWYGNKEPAGISLEQIDRNKPCQEAGNWAASSSPAGGSPGAINSIAESRPDLMGPALLSVSRVDSLLTLVFDEKLNHRSRGIAAITINEEDVQQWDFASLPFPDRVNVWTGQALLPDLIYTIKASGFYDCAGNRSREDQNSASLIIPVAGDSADILLSEILFNPQPGGTDFVEVYNQSAHFIDLSRWLLQNQTDSLGTSRISTKTLIIPPYSFLVFTESISKHLASFPGTPSETLVETDIPSLPDDAGSIWLLDENGGIMEGMDYDEDQHHPLLYDAEGIALERISFEVAASEIDNWTSASRSAGFATPGRPNSQQQEFTPGEEAFQISPAVLHYHQAFAEDFFTISYELEHSGWLGDLSVFSASGELISQLARQKLLGEQGFFTWAGTDEQGAKVPTGYYILYINLWDDRGNQQEIRKTLAVGN